MQLNIPETTWQMFSEVLWHWKHSVHCPTHAWVQPTNLAYSFWWGWKVRSQRGTLNLARKESLKSWGISSAVNTCGQGECRQPTWNLSPSLLSSWWQSHTHSSKVCWSEHFPLVPSKVDADRAGTSRDETHCGLPPTLQAQNKSLSSTSSSSSFSFFSSFFFSFSPFLLLLLLFLVLSTLLFFFLIYHYLLLSSSYLGLNKI